MKNFVFLLCLHTSVLQAQEHAWVYFKDKPHAEFFINNPLTMLSQRAIDRRNRQNINIIAEDTPLEDDYVLMVKNSTGISIKAKSKWLNAVHVTGLESEVSNLLSLTFVDYIEFANKNIEEQSTSIAKLTKTSKTNKLKNINVNYDYVVTNNQTNILGVEGFHQANFLGQGIQIAVMDAGFFGVNTAAAFSHLLDDDESNGEILGGYDYVNMSNEFYQNTGTVHGTQVLSTIGALKEGEYLGTAPKANFYLFITEDNINESPLEESLWVQAAESADSLGVDIINTSLGYNQFDDSKYNYTYEDMDGETTFITRGANIAAKKGIVLVNSIGNSGDEYWKYLTAPADAKNIVAVGAVDTDKNITSFSSFGPTADGRIKPETLTQGANVYVINQNDEIGVSSGTSFSSPLVAGAIACLWQAYPNKTSLEIREMVMENSNLFLSPTDQEGYGVLDLYDLTPTFLTNNNKEESLPFYVIRYGNLKELEIHLNNNANDTSLQLVSALGSVLVNQKLTKTNNSILVKNVSPGIYYIKYFTLDKHKVITIYINK